MIADLAIEKNPYFYADAQRLAARPAIGRRHGPTRHSQESRCGAARCGKL